MRYGTIVVWRRGGRLNAIAVEVWMVRIGRAEDEWKCDGECQAEEMKRWSSRVESQPRQCFGGGERIGKVGYGKVSMCGGSKVKWGAWTPYRMGV